MRFLLEVHVAASIGRALVGHGYDVLRSSDAHADWSDARLLDLAVRERLVLVTEDRDFSDLVFRDGAAPPPAILYLRYNPAEQPNSADRVLLILANTSIDGHMVVIRRTGVRLRPFPEKSDPDA